MKTLKIISAFALLLSAFVSVDLGINCMALAVSEFQDGIAYNSVLQSGFNLLNQLEINTQEKFFYAFRTSMWITFAIFAENVILSIFKTVKN